VKLDQTIKGINYSIKVDQKLIDETIENLTSQYGESTNPEVSEAGDFIYGDLKSSTTDFSKTVSADISKLSKKLAGKFIGLSKEAVVEFESKEVKKDEWTAGFGLSDQEAEDAKIGIRNHRKDSNSDIKKLEKEGVSEDLCKKAEEDVQKLTDTFIKKVEEHLALKEAEIMKV
jgi:trigger factor